MPEMASTCVALYLNRRLRSQAIHDLNAVIYCTQIGTGKNLGVHAATTSTGDDSEGEHPLYLLNSPLSSAQRAWSNICAPRLVQRICCLFAIRQSTSSQSTPPTLSICDGLDGI